MSWRTLDKMEEVVNASKEDPIQFGELPTKIDSGKVSIKKAYKRVLKEQKKEQRKKTAILVNDKRVELIEGDFNEKCDVIPDNSIDLLFTDPPYDWGALHLYEKLAKLSSRVLKEGSSLVTYCSEELEYKYQVIGFMKAAGLTPAFEIHVLLEGNGNALYKEKCFVKCKSLLVFTKGKPNAIHYIPNAKVISSEKPDKLVHEWEQSIIEANHCIKYLTVEGETILDPMMGGATTIIAALESGRKAKGCEDNSSKPEAFAEASNRVAEWISKNEEVSV